MAVEAYSGMRAKRHNIRVREMEIDDLAKVFHLGEKLFKAKKAPNLYRTWDEYEVADLPNHEPDS
jgi:hypothetical protein